MSKRARRRPGMILMVSETIVMSAQQNSQTPERDSGDFHLTAKGWIRKNTEPFPADRLETWRYEMVQPSGDAKAQVRPAKAEYRLYGFLNLRMN
jgi:hypothetical protein